MATNSDNPKIKSLSSGFLTFFILLAIFILIMGGIRTCHRNSNDKKEAKESVSSSGSNIPNSVIIYPDGRKETSYPEVSKSGKYYVTIKYIIDLTPEWSKLYTIKDYESVGFKESNVPYCVQDRVGRETCGGIKEDVSSYFEEKIPNQSYRFRSQTGNGKITLKVWRPIRSR